MKKQEYLSHIGSMQQVAYARRIRYGEGRASGMQAIEVKNGPMRFISMADKALDIAELEYKGRILNFLTKPGLNGRNQFDTNGKEAQRSIMCGLFFTCGFENVGGPYIDSSGTSFPMHGRMRTTPAEHVCADAQWVGDDYVITLSGEMRESELFGENLVLRRKISTHLNSPQITVQDTITNEAFRDEPAMWMYHCNFGWPLLAPECEIIIPSHRIVPKDERSKDAVGSWSKVCGPIANEPELVYMHELASDPQGHTFAGIINRQLGLGLTLDFSVSDFPNFLEWKSMAAGDYVVGLEPANSAVMYERTKLEHQQLLRTIPPQTSETKTLTFTIHEGTTALDSLVHRRDSLLER